MQKVILLTETCTASLYGIGTYISNIKNALYKMDDMVLYIVDLMSAYKCFKVDIDENIYTISVPAMELIDNNMQNRRNRSISYLLSRFISPNESVVIHVNFNHHYNIVLNLRKIYAYSRVICAIHYLKWCFDYNGNSSYIKATIKKNKCSLTRSEINLLEEIKQDIVLFKNMDLIICLSNYTKSLLMDIYGVDSDKIKVVYNACTMHEKNCAGDSGLRLKMGFDNDEKIILFVGRLDQIKGVEFLIEAFRILQAKRNVRLVIIGDGDFSKYLSLTKNIWSKVSFVGKIDQHLLSDFYRIADVGVLPSFHEQCSYVAIEMMKYLLPIIGTSSTGLSEMIDDGYTGCKINLLENYNDVVLCIDDLVSCIERILNNKDYFNNSILDFRTRYDSRIFEGKMKYIYRQICKL